MKKEGINPKLIIGLILLTAALAAAAVLAFQVKDLADQAVIEASLTPTPVPAFGNAMIVTADPNTTPVPVLRVGSQGDDVKNLQARLQTLGYYSGAVDGQYGNGTRDAVYAFQQANGLEADGLAGSQTTELLYSPYAKSADYGITPEPAAETAAPAAEASPAAVSALDGSFPLLVNSTHPLPDGFQTTDLVNLTKYCDKKIVTIKANGIDGERVAVDALMEMLRAAHEDGITVWQISAGYRSVKYQQELFDNQVYKYRKQGYSSSKAKALTKKTVAEPGCSEHHTGLAFDITVPGSSFKGTKQALWLEEHCWEYGFILRYREDKTDITGIDNEPWHFRYVGVEHSLIMRDENLCLEEYVEKYGNQEL